MKIEAHKKWRLLLADSGGTKTDWCAIGADNKRTYFSTESFHPSNFSDEFVKRNKAVLSPYISDDLQLRFYGAGCVKEEGRLKSENVLKQIGFTKFNVQSDLVGASNALNNDGHWTAICGTGSVLFKVENNDVVELRGGKGHEVGDEGSGFYFGKLFLEEMHKGNVGFQELYKKLPQAYHDSENEKFKLASLAYYLHEFNKDKEIIELHKRNVSLFLDKEAHGVKDLSICGSYAYHHKALFYEVCETFSIELRKIIEKPISKLTDYVLDVTDK